MHAAVDTTAEHYCCNELHTLLPVCLMCNTCMCPRQAEVDAVARNHTLIAIVETIVGSTR